MDITKRARKLRKSMTDAERVLWQKLRNRQLSNYKFYRQYPLPPYYVDFLCRSIKLIIEVDGGQHCESANDKIRTDALKAQGYEIIRFWNNDVLNNIEGVLMKILDKINSLTPALSLKEEGALCSDNLPTPKQENWKYTNISRSLGADLLEVEPQEPQEILIHKNRGEVCGKPEEILWTGVDGQHQNPRLKIVLEEGAQATIIERHNGEGAYWKNMSTEIVLGANSRLNHVRIQEDSLAAIQTNMVHITMERDVYLNSFSLNLGGKLTRHDIHAVINGSGAECALNGVNLLSGSQHGDTTILMEHIAPHCQSNQFYRTILDDRARGVFQGKILVQKPAQQTDGYQLSNTLMLSDKCEMDTKPELEIYADDVKCSHGSTTGQLDAEPLFYLRSRGLSEHQARKLLVQAFVDEVVDKIVDEHLCSEVKEKAGAWLDQALSK